MFKAVGLIKTLINLYGKDLAYIVILILLINFWFVTFGTGVIFKEATFSATYDSLAQSLLKGQATVDMSAVGPEAFIVNGKIFTNYGPFPALIRILPNLLFPSLYGKWCAIFCFLGTLLSLFAFLLITHKQLFKNHSLLIYERKKILFFSLFGFGIGSPILFLMASPSFYHEARVWGICWSLWSIYYFLNLLENSQFNKRNLLGFSTTCGLAIMSREIYGISLYLILALVTVFVIKNVFERKLEYLTLDNINLFKEPALLKKFFSLIILISPAILILSFQFWYNYERFESIFKFNNYKYYYSFITNPKSLEIVENTGGILNFKRIPFSMLKYLGFNRKFFIREFPFVNLVTDTPDDSTIDQHKKLFHYIEPSIPLTIVSPWIIFGAILGTYRMLRKLEEKIILKLSAIILFLPFLITCSIYYVSHRYSSDLLPYGVFTYSYFLSEVGRNNCFYSNKDKIINAIKLLCIISCITTILSTLHWSAYMNWITPIECKTSIIEFFKRTNSFWFN